MSTERNPPIPDKEIQIPEWEHSAAPKGDVIQDTRSRTINRGEISARLDQVLPPHKRYLGRSRKTFLWLLLAVVLALLALIVGLAVGLTQRSK